MIRTSALPVGRAVLAIPLVALLTVACSDDRTSLPFENQQPGVEFTEGALEGTENEYSIRFGWNSWDADGKIVRHEYAVDPPAEGDTAWIALSASQITLFYRSDQPDDPLPGPGHNVSSFGGHTFAVRAIDSEGAASEAVARSFTSRTIAPYTQILSPPVSGQQPSITTPSVLVRWDGFDPDGLLTQKPIRYKWKIVPATDIDAQAPGGITAKQVQEYFEADAFNRFAAWDSVSGDTTSLAFEGLTPGTIYYLAISALDEAGAYEPRFRRGDNVLWFQPSLNRLGPALCVYNEFFRHCFKTGGVSFVESRTRDVELPASSRVGLSFEGTPITGTVLNGYRWRLDPANGDVSDEDPRVNDADLAHWSSWSLNETSILLPAFPPPAFEGEAHRVYVEVRDNLGFITLMTLRLKPVAPQFDRPLLVIDDTFGTKTPNPPVGLGPYPMEAEEDSFHFAHGGFFDPLTGRTSERGVFMDFAPKVIDYATTPDDGIALATLSHYRAVVWFTDHNSASRSGSKIGSLNPSTALRLINSAGRLNTLAVYLRQGGRVWLFGDGTPTAIANGFANQLGVAIPMFPYVAGSAPNDILRSGNFLWDFVHIRSELDLGDRTGGNSFTREQQFKSALPYLPQFAGPPGQPPPPDRSTDPRIGPSSARTAERWNGLPRLTLAHYRTSNDDFAERSVAKLSYVAKPLFSVEGSGADFGSTVDTLYLFQARVYDPIGTRAASDGKPMALHYHGSAHGGLVWTAFPLCVMEREQARSLVAKVMEVFEIAPERLP